MLKQPVKSSASFEGFEIGEISDARLPDKDLRQLLPVFKIRHAVRAREHATDKYLADRHAFSLKKCSRLIASGALWSAIYCGGEHWIIVASMAGYGPHHRIALRSFQVRRSQEI